ncbi:unnamed protein product [Camellia sinensis]
MESARAEVENERAQTANRLRSDAEERANTSEESLKLAKEALAKVEAELEELRKAKEKANSKASAAFEAGKSPALKDYVEEKIRESGIQTWVAQSPCCRWNYIGHANSIRASER